MSALADEPGIPATLPFAGAALPCTIWPVGEPLPGRIGPMVAMHDETTDQWTVAPASEVADSPSYELARLLFERSPPRRVAVLDDDSDSAQSIVDFLGAKGMDAQPFNCAVELLAAMETEPFDGFVVDWLLGDTTAKDLLSKIRARVPSGPGGHPHRPDRDRRVASEEELAMVGASYRALLFEKPTRPLTIFNALQVGFTSRRRQLPEGAEVGPWQALKFERHCSARLSRLHQSTPRRRFLWRIPRYSQTDTDAIGTN
jgi:CheY-like chemotaxis protein